MIRFLYFCLKISIAVGIFSVCATIYLIYHYSKDLPDYSQLSNYHPPSVTRIYSADGKLIEEYAIEHRVFVPISSVPRSLVEAFVAAEDKNFFNHPGVDVLSILRAAIANVSNIMQHKRMEGGSTITQQVVKNFLLTSERSLERKVKEAILSYMISDVLSKEQILELYLNQTFLGKGAYGVAIAAQNYFNKSVDELDLAESAFLAGLPKAPSNYDPERNYKRAKDRRDYVLVRMFEDGYITEEAARAAIETPVKTYKRNRSETVTADYYAEGVREEIIRMVGKEQFYTGGLTIITSLNASMQEAAQKALRKGIRDYDQKKGFRKAIANINIDNWLENLKKIARPASLLEYKLAVVLDVSDSQAKIGLLDGSTSKIALADMKWARSELKSAGSILKKGDVIVVEALKNDYALKQIPEVNGGIMVMHPYTGQVLAAQGGYDFAHSKFNRVTQALRQPGSLMKTFVYLAALENGVQPNKIFEDGPIAISQGAGMPSWKPKNYKGDFLGLMTMRTGLEKSRNLITVRVAQTIGLPKVAEIVKRFGINHEPKTVYSMVLGSLETTLEKMTAAYATIANSGKKVTPHFVELVKDRNGKILYRRDDRYCENCKVPDNYLNDAEPPVIAEKQERMITDEASAYQITSFMSGVIQRGTGTAAKKLGKTIAGKTGTTNDSKDTWFVGFTPRIIVGTYIGYDTPRDMGKRATGSNVSLPVFINFMEQVYKDVPSLEFKVPESIKLISVDPTTGTHSSGKGSIMETFKVNDAPSNVGITEPIYEGGEGESAPHQQNGDIFERKEPTHQVDQSEEIY